MFEIILYVNTIERVKKFCNVAEKECKGKVIVETLTDKPVYRIDGKSIMGMFSLDLSKELRVVCETEDDLNIIVEEYVNKIKSAKTK